MGWGYTNYYDEPPLFIIVFGERRGFYDRGIHNSTLFQQQSLLLHCFYHEGKIVFVDPIVD